MSNLAQAGQGELWTDAPPDAAPATSSAVADAPSVFRRVNLSVAGLTRGHRISRAKRSAAREAIDLPLPDGGISRFTVEDAHVMPAEMAERFPRLRNLVGHDAEGRRARIDVDEAGMVHASVSDRKGDWLLGPEAPADQAARRASRLRPHQVYRVADLPPPKPFTEALVTARGAIPQAPSENSSARKESGQPLRTFRIAISATSEYVAAVGGTVTDGLAAVTRMVNRLNEIFEADLGVHFELAEANDRLIFTDAATDPFRASKTTLDLMLRNIKVAAEQLPRETFDIGHVVHIGQGSQGRAFVSTTCLQGDIATPLPPVDAMTSDDWRRIRDKAGGVTIADAPFSHGLISTLAHEVGHQFGAGHTLNIDMEQRDPKSAVEPGSGSTIMSYAGRTRANLQNRADMYFHAKNLEEMRSWLASGGGSCAMRRENPIPAPLLDRDLPETFTVPARTAFTLPTELRFVRDGAIPTLTFEQMDLGPAQPSQALTDPGGGPIFRSRPPTTLSDQTFPAMDVLLGNEPFGVGDTWPATNRTLRFRATARDNLGRHSHVVSRDMSVRVVDTGAAFQVTSPVADAAVNATRPLRIAWEVAGTDKSPIACTHVNIKLSEDGGQSFRMLKQNVANSGAATLSSREITAARQGGDDDASSIPGRARIMVSCNRDITPFFALSPGDFTLK